MTTIKDIDDMLYELCESATCCFNEIEAIKEMMKDAGIKPSQIENWDAIKQLRKACKPIKAVIVEVQV